MILQLKRNLYVVPVDIFPIFHTVQVHFITALGTTTHLKIKSDSDNIIQWYHNWENGIDTFLVSWCNIAAQFLSRGKINSLYIYDILLLKKSGSLQITTFFKWFTTSRRITLKTTKTHHNQSKRHVIMLNAQMNSALLHRCSNASEYNVKTRFLCIWD